MTEDQEIRLSESFYSVQAEGVTTGVPSYFVRISNCNLCCGGLKGELVERGKATWICDTVPVWTKFEPITFEGLVEKIETEGKELGIPLLQWLVEGKANFVWTGGEPTMDHSRTTIEKFLDYWRVRFPDNQSYHELETNGTIACPTYEKEPKTFYDLMDQINCSPKLANSGMKEAARIKEDAIRQIAAHNNSWFKFVISNEEDIAEFERDYIEPFDIDPRQVVIMPGLDCVEDAPERTAFLYEMSKKHGYRGITRGHIVAWNKTTGV